MTSQNPLPAIPPVPGDLSPELRAYLEAMKEVSEVRAGVRGDPKDRAVTLRELFESGLAKELKAAPFDPNNITQINIGFEANPPALNVPPSPTGLSAAGGFTKIVIEFDNPRLKYGNHSLTEIHRNSSNDITTAQLIGVTTGLVYSDNVSSGSTHYYWIRHVSDSGVTGPFNSSTGTVASTVSITSIDIADDAITETKIADDSISTPKMQANSITAASGIIANAAIGTAQIANAAVDSAKIADAAITNAKINDLNAGKINTGSLNVNRITDGSIVVYDKAAGGTVGSIKTIKSTLTRAQQQIGNMIGPPFSVTQYVAALPYQTAPSPGSGINMPRAQLHSFTTPNYTGPNPNYVFQINVQFFGTLVQFGLNTGYVVMTLGTSSSATATGSILNEVRVAFGTASLNQFFISGEVTLAKNTTYYLSVYTATHDISLPSASSQAVEVVSNYWILFK